MARKMRLDFPGALHLISNHGNDQKPIFKDDEDYNSFLNILHFAANRYGFKFHGYALMPNHYIVLVETPLGELSLGMRHINGAYAEYFNTRHDRTGHLFQGRFKSILIEKTDNLPGITRYIHQIPAQSLVTLYPWTHHWSSCRDYLGLRPSSPWLTMDETLNYFGSERNIQQINYKLFLEAQNEENPWDKAMGSTIIGTDAYLEKIKQTIKPILKKKNLPWPNVLAVRPKAEQAIEAVCSVFTINRQEILSSRWKHSDAKAAALYLLRERCGLSLQEIASQFNLTPAGVCKAAMRLSSKLPNNNELNAKLIRVQKLIEESLTTPVPSQKTPTSTNEKTILASMSAYR